MIRFHSIENLELGHFLERHKSGYALQSEIALDVLLRQVLEKAYEFVPSDSGSILLDDPRTKQLERDKNELVFIAAFGSAGESLIGKSLSATNGIAGRVYQTGLPYLSQNVKNDQYFFSKIDETTGHRSESIVAVPIYIGKDVCGVLELINRSDGKPFTKRELTLLEIFAGYTSFTLQNALEAKRAHELAKKDDLTGLYNDRWFHVRLSETLIEAEETGQGCVLIFMDLDNFKTVNDCYGHLAGSQALREAGFLIARVVQAATQTAVTSRYGGDEFVIILPETGVESGVAIAEAVRKAVEAYSFLDRPYGFGMPAIHLRDTLTASIGLAYYSPAGRHFPLDVEKNNLLRRADTAMYEAKSSGKNRVVVAGAAEPNRVSKEG
jgi:diguanylate cyclase (GGDEF)-like protein